MELAEASTAEDRGGKDRAQLASELDEARKALAEFEEAAAIALQRQVETAVDGIRRELAAECEQNRRLLADTEEAAAIALERQIASAVERSRSEQAVECEAVQEENRKLKADLDEANQLLAEIKQAYRRDLLERKEDTAERERLVQELHEARASLAEQAAAVVVRAAGDPAATLEAIRAETARTEVLMQELSDAIDNAETNLSDVVRKAAERAQLEAYIKGLWFSANLPA